MLLADAECRKAAFENPTPYVTVAEGEGPTIYPQWRMTGPGSFTIDSIPSPSSFPAAGWI